MRGAAPLLLVALLLPTGCQSTRDTVSTAKDCASLAADLARTGLSRVPTQAEAEQAVQRLDDRVAGLDSPDVKRAAGQLRDRLREFSEAARDKDPAKAQAALARARTAAADTAEACGLPADQFLGS